MADRSCETCKEWWFDDIDANGKAAFKSKPLTTGRGEPLKRPVNPRTKKPETPCHLCPKKSPAEAHKSELSPKNMQTLQLYYQVRLCGATPEMRDDGPLMERLSIVDRITRAHEQSRAMGSMLSLGGSG